MSEQRFNAEQQAEYDKEMQRLEAEAGATPKPGVKADAATTSTVKDDAKADTKTDAPTETAEQLSARVASAEKALKDTQRWAHENAAKVKRLEREAEERKRTETRPAILDANPGLEDAIKHVAAPAQPSGQQEWLQTVAHAIPDVETLLAEPAFFAKAKERQATLGAEWDNPLTAIRELSDLKTEHLSNRNTTLALDAARKDFAEKAKKRSAMEMPGGSGGRDTQQKVDEVQAVWAMSDADFAKQRNKVMGF